MGMRKKTHKKAPNDLGIIISQSTITIMIRTLYGLVDGEGHKILLHDFLDFYDRLLNGEELEIRQESFLGPIEEIGFILDDPSTIEEITQRKV